MHVRTNWRRFYGLAMLDGEIERRLDAEYAAGKRWGCLIGLVVGFILGILWGPFG